MIWSIIKILVFIGVAAALTWGASLVLETPGEVRIAFAGREIALSPLGFLIGFVVVMLLAWAILRIVGLLVAVLRFLTGDQTAISRYFDRNRERRGFDALGESLIALATGDARKAQITAQKAERLLDRPELTRLVNAQSAELGGNKDRALAYYKEMLGDDRTRFLGVQGLLRQKLDEGDTDTALRLAEKAFALQPRHGGTIDTLFRLQAQKEDWAGARKTLAAKVRTAALTRDVGRRREAVLSLADARAALARGDEAKAREAAYAANKLSPGFTPAAALAAELHARAGEGRQAARILKKAWTDAPHPDLAAAFAAIEPGETPSARAKRFDPFLKLRADHPEARMVAAELALAAEDFPGARRALGDLAETQPTTRSLALMAAIERGEGAPDSVVRGWLAKALEAPRGEAWVCEACNTAHGSWAPVCEQCQSFDTLSWKLPPAAEEAGSGTAMLPLIVGALQRPEPEPEPAPAPEPKAEAPRRPTPKAEDAEIADAPPAQKAETAKPARPETKPAPQDSDAENDTATPRREPVRTSENLGEL
ncbi:heme biosynthesis protein HemY [Halovulum dunhuangense]|uniref:Heme biosynthesis protein HemY n=1 Tax=Halovulum dunhuangense TaxID=1505036 RepID=A0A849KQW7_9RHOB|nr:heme biosynthesis HemY N-terminal domain-containing protein [Halovulum dunhuangense]NNU79259.1 heme biosynthesis protein HemY [Halovulum dunhuangense]